MFLVQYSTSNVRAQFRLSPLQTANCSRVERNWFCRMERFLQTALAITGRHRTFFYQRRTHWIEWVSKQTKHVQLVGWYSKLAYYKITKYWTGYSVVRHFTVPHYCTFFFFKNKNRCAVSINFIGVWRDAENFFWGIEEMPSCPKMNLVSTGQSHSTCY